MTFTYLNIKSTKKGVDWWEHPDPGCLSAEILTHLPADGQLIISETFYKLVEILLDEHQSSHISTL